MLQRKAMEKNVKTIFRLDLNIEYYIMNWVKKNEINAKEETV